jgi:hypothetical protein
MAKTKQTAARSTGGRAPRAELARKAARNSGTEDRPAQHITYVLDSDGASMYEVKYMDGTCVEYAVNQAQTVIGPEIRHWCELRPGRMLTTSIYERWNLCEWLPRDSSKSNSRPISFKLHEIKLEHEETYTANVENNKKEFFKIVFCDIGWEEPEDVQASYLDKADDWCTKHDGCVYLLSPLGRRVNLCSEPIPTSIGTALPIIYHTDRAGCASAAVSNLIYRCDAVEADRIYRIGVDHRFRHLRDLAAWLMSHTRWMLRRVQTAEKHPEALLDHVLGQSRGMFIVTPKAAAEYGNHAIGVDQARKLVYDSVENYAMVTSIESFNRCVNGRCTGFHDIRELVRCPTTRKKRKRGGK